MSKAPGEDPMQGPDDQLVLTDGQRAHNAPLYVTARRGVTEIPAMEPAPRRPSRHLVCLLAVVRLTAAGVAVGPAVPQRGGPRASAGSRHGQGTACSFAG